jgi:hypothetical protein
MVISSPPLPNNFLTQKQKFSLLLFSRCLFTNKKIILKWIFFTLSLVLRNFSIIIFLSSNPFRKKFVSFLLALRAAAAAGWKKKVSRVCVCAMWKESGEKRAEKEKWSCQVCGGDDKEGWWRCARKMEKLWKIRAQERNDEEKVKNVTTR